MELLDRKTHRNLSKKVGLNCISRKGDEIACTICIYRDLFLGKWEDYSNHKILYTFIDNKGYKEFERIYDDSLYQKSDKLT